MNKSNKNTILLSANTLWYLDNFRAHIIEELIRKKYDVIVMGAPGTAKYSFPKNVQVIEINNKITSFNIWKILTYLLKIRSSIKMIDTKYILSFTPSSNIALLLFRPRNCKTMIVNVSGIGTVGNDQRLKSIFFQFYSKLLGRANTIFVQNTHDLETLVAYNAALSSKSRLLMGSGVDTDAFRFKKLCKDIKGKTIFIMTCRLLREKGVEDYLACASQLTLQYENVVFKLAGIEEPDRTNGYSHTTMRKMCEKANVEYLGEQRDLANLYANSSYAVLPTIYNEGVPKSLIEAGSCGLPLIASDKPGCKEIVEDGLNGFIFEAGNFEQFKQATERAINTPDRIYEKMSTASRERVVELFSVTENTAAYFKELG